MKWLMRWNKKKVKTDKRKNKLKKLKQSVGNMEIDYILKTPMPAIEGLSIPEVTSLQIKLRGFNSFYDIRGLEDLFEKSLRNEQRAKFGMLAELKGTDIKDIIEKEREEERKKAETIEIKADNPKLLSGNEKSKEEKEEEEEAKKDAVEDEFEDETDISVYIEEAVKIVESSGMSQEVYKYIEDKFLSIAKINNTETPLHKKSIDGLEYNEAQNLCGHILGYICKKKALRAKRA